MRHLSSLRGVRLYSQLIIVVTLLLAGFSAKAQCNENFSVYQTYPYGQLCSPQYVMLRAEYYGTPGDLNYGEFRWYTSATSPYPVQTNPVSSDPGVNTGDYYVYASPGVTVWVSFYNYNTGCESYRVAYNFYFVTMPNLYQDYAVKCGYDVAKIQLSSDVPGVTFQLYELYEYYDPYYGYVQNYQLSQSNTTGYFELPDFDLVGSDKYFVRIYEASTCSQNYYYPINFDITPNNPPVVTGNLSVAVEGTTTLTASASNIYTFRWYDANGNEVHTGYQYALPANLAAGNYTYQVRGMNWSGTCFTDPTWVTVTANLPAVTYSSLYNSANFTKTIDLGKPVGTVNGVAGASGTGGITYTIPVYTPPGTNTLQPTVAIVYNSQGSNGNVGFGWDIAGLSVISRIGKNMHYNGLVAPVTYTSNDAFVLDGVRLNPVSGTNGADGTVYSGETENFAKIISYGSSANNPDWFKVIRKDGTTMEYGHSTDSRLLTDNTANVMLWQITKITDVSGNYIAFKYENGFRDSRITEINYTGNSITGQVPYNKVTFGYEARADVGTMYEAGASLTSKLLLKNITVMNESSVVKSYQFNYGFDNINSLLKEVIETGSDGTSLNSTIFLYGDQPQNIQVQTTTALTGSYDFFAGDFDADGKTDLLAANLYYDQGIKYHSKYEIRSEISAGSSTVLYINNLPAGNSVNVTEKKFNNFLTSDYNGDGRDDVLMINTGLASVFPSGNKRIVNNTTINYTGSFNSSTGYTNYTTATYPVPVTFAAFNFIHDKGNFFVPGDFDGDGNQDYILILARKRTEVRPFPLPKIDYFDFKAFMTNPATGEINSEILSFGIGANTNPDFYAGTVAGADLVIPVDFDGDGKQEILVTKDQQSYVLSLQRIPASTGFSFMASVVATTGEIVKDARVFPGDFNADRKTDMLVRNTNGSWKIIYSTGTSFVSAGFSFNQAPNITGSYSDDKIFVSDFNGDGKSDIAHGFPVWVNGTSSSSKFSLYYSKGGNNGASFYYEQYPYNNVLSYGEITVGDFNGDGRSDLLNRYNVSSPADFIAFKPFGKERLLVKATDGHNVTTSFDYKLLTDKSSYPYFYNRTVSLDDPSNHSPFNYIQFPMYVVTGLTSPDGIGGLTTTTFLYENAVLHRGAKGFLGFKKVTSRNLTTGISAITENEINTQFAIPYTVKQSSRLTVTDELLSESVNTTSFVSLSTGYLDPKRFVQHTDKTLNVNYLTGAASETVNTYDNYGNITVSVIKTGALSGSTVAATTTVTTTTTYGAYNTPVPALPDNITVSKVRSGMPALSNTTSITYTATGLPATQTDFAGLPKAVVTTYTYNQFGNPVTKTISAAGLNSRTTTYTYDGKGRLGLTKQIGGSGILQTEAYTYDFKWGKPLTYTSADCLTSSYEYDAFGRLKKTTLPAGNIINYSLNWDVQGVNVYYSFTDYSGGNPDTKTWFDKLNREVKKQIAGFNNQWLTQVITYDAKGNIATQTNNYYSSESPLVTINSFDNYNRIQTIVNPLRTVNYAYALLSGGRIQETTSSAGISAAKITDATGRVVTAIDNGGQLDFSYDSRDNETEIRHSGTVLLAHTYDSYGHQTSVTDKNAGTVSYTYDAFGQLTQQTDNAVHSTTMSYDDLGRIVSRQGPEGTTTYEYYKDLTTGCSNNNLSKITGFNGIIKENTYDNLKRLQSEITTVAGVPYTTQYQYDTYSNLTKITYPSGVVVNNGFDSNGELTAVTGGDAASPTTLFSGTQMNGFGQYTAYTLGNNRASQVTYTNGFPTRYYTAGIQDLNLNFDPARGNLLSRQEAIKNVTESFQYDALNRLTQTAVNSVPQLNMSYDGNGSFSMGNITSKTDAGSYVYKSDKIHGIAYITNPAGPLVPPVATPVNMQQISYTPFSRAAIISEGTYQLDYTYGADYQRIQSILRQNNAIIETKYYFGNYEKQVTSGQLREIHYVTGGNGLCAVIVRQAGVNNFYFAYTDHLGSLLTLTDINGNVVAEQNFDAWGRNRNPANWQYSGVPAVPAWLYRGYTGHEHLAQFGIINMNGRLYDPVQARMMSPDNYVADPFNTQGYNRYAYALNNPLIYADPDGNFPVLIVIIGAVVGAYSGGMVANNGQLNPFKWDWSSGKTWGYFLGGAVVGAGSAYLGATVAASGAAFANTGGLMLGSFTNSLGMAVLTGGQTTVGINFGIASFNFDSGELGYLGKKGNSLLDNIGFALGAVANVQDALAGLHPESVYLQTENISGSEGSGKDLIGHTQLVDKTGKILIDYGPKDPGTGRFIGFSPGKNTWENGNQVIQKMGNKFTSSIEIKGVNLARLQRIATKLNSNPGKYNFLLKSCSSVASRSLTLSGVRLFGGIHPYTLRLAALLRNEGIRPSIFSYYLTGN